MATDRGVANALGILAETFPTREISKRTAEVWATVFSGVDDEALEKAIMRLVREPGRTFFPSSGEVFGAIATDAPAADTLAILHRIERLGHYDPHRGWVYPNYSTISKVLGEEIAKAYAVAGTTALFSDDDKNGQSITRDIARRCFDKEIERVNKATPERLRLSAPQQRPVPPCVEGPKIRTPRLLKPGEKTPMSGIVATVMEEIKAAQTPESVGISV